MIELLRNCSNGNEVSTYLVNAGSSAGKIVKAAATSIGINNLRREVDGWDWYQKIRPLETGEPICRIVQEKKHYLKIEIKFIDGTRVDCREGLEKNHKMIQEIVGHYCEIWPRHPDNESPLHGDLSLDNVIYGADGVCIIDWEHFHEKGAPWGFDPLYMLFETLFLRIRNRRQPSSKEIDIIAGNIVFLNNRHKLQSQMMDRPLRFLVDFIISNYTLWGRELALFRNKFPILAFTPDRVSSIDKMVCSELRARA
jgi:hypothetical protein